MGFFDEVVKIGTLGAIDPGSGSGWLEGMVGGGTTPQGYTSSTATQQPWSVQAPYLERGFQRAEDLYKQGAPGYYPGPTVAGFDPATIESQRMQEERAMAGSPLLREAQTGLQQTLSGEFLGENPYLKQMIGSAQDEAQKRLASTFGTSGRYGSGLHKIGLGEELADIEAGVLGRAYEAERGRQMQAAQMAPQMALADYYDPQQLAAVGVDRETQAQRIMDAERKKYEYEAMAPRQNLADYMQSIQGQYGGTTTQQDPIYQDRASGMLGGALAGGQLFGIPGAIGGGILGML